MHTLVYFKSFIFSSLEEKIGSRMTIVLVIAWFAFIFNPVQLLSQNLETIGKNKPLTISGGISLNNVVYAASGKSYNRNPFTYVASANINFDLYGWSVPFSFMYSNQRGQFQQPFNQYGLSPTYKWITAHLGYRSMTFSPYTLNGHIFLGAGAELKPSSKFKVSTMYGRLQKAVIPDSTANALPVFERYGTGLNIVYTDRGNGIGLQLFRAWDELNPEVASANSQNVFPMENFVIGITGSTALLKNVILNIDAASSAITQDKRSPDYEGNTHWMGRIPALYQSKVSSSYHQALKSTLSYKSRTYTLALGYERVDPGYRTLGAYYFNNDLENITAGIATAFWQNKITLSINGGTQKNNLDQDKINTMQRIIGSANASIAVNSKTNVTLSYSNFQTYTNITNRKLQDINQLIPYNNLDTLNYIQISQSANVGFSFTPNSAKDYRKAFNATLVYQSSNDKQGGGNSNTAFYSGNIAYNYNVISTNTGLTLSLSGNYTGAEASNNLTAGPTVGLNKALWNKKLKASFSTSYNLNYANSTLLKRVLNFRISNAYIINKHSFSMGLVLLHHKTKRENDPVPGIIEFTGTIGYNYNFSR